MDPNGSSSTSRRKVKFVPKAPTRTKLKTTPLNQELHNENDFQASEAQILLRQFTENRSRQSPKKPEKKMQVTFGAGVSNSSMIRSFGVPKEERTIKTDEQRVKSFGDNQIPKLLPSSFSKEIESFETYKSFEDVGPGGSTRRQETTYREPWDYSHSYYPTVLPLRPPYSGDPEILNAVEFGKTDKAHDESCTNSASELGLMDDNEPQGKMILFQLPSILPILKRPASIKGKGKENARSSSSFEGQTGPSKRVKLEELPAGYVGKMLVYKSGAVKLRVGDILYDVSPGSDVNCAQDVMAINTSKKKCCALGDLEKRAVVVPDLDHLLNSVIDLG